MSDVPVTATPEGDVGLWREAGAAFSAWRAGRAPLDDLVRLVSPVLWQVVRATGLDRDEAEDVVQTTWLALVDQADRISRPVAVGGWLCTTARRQAWRTARQGGRTFPMRDEVIDERLPRQSGPEHEVLLDERDAALRAALHRLTERCGTLLRILAAQERQPYEDIAEELGMPVGSIGPTRRRCLDKLRVELEEAGAL